jgi:hypothetical protein
MSLSAGYPCSVPPFRHGHDPPPPAAPAHWLGAQRLPRDEALSHSRARVENVHLTTNEMRMN